MCTREATGAVSDKRAVDSYAESPFVIVRTWSCLMLDGLQTLAIGDRPKSRVSMPTATRPSLIPQRCAIRNRSCFEKSGQSVGKSFRRESCSCSMRPSTSLSDRACRIRAIWGEDSKGEVDEEDADPRKSQRTCRRVQLML